MRFEPVRFATTRAGRPSSRLAINRAVVVLPLVPVTSTAPWRSSRARRRRTLGSMARATSPGKVVPPPRPLALDRVRVALPARTAIVRRTASGPHGGDHRGSRDRLSPGSRPVRGQTGRAGGAWHASGCTSSAGSGAGTTPRRTGQDPRPIPGPPALPTELPPGPEGGTRRTAMPGWEGHGTAPAPARRRAGRGPTHRPQV